jgi:hypothetical protein
VDRPVALGWTLESVNSESVFLGRVTIIRRMDVLRKFTGEPLRDM